MPDVAFAVLKQARNKIDGLTRERDQIQTQLTDEKNRNAELAEANRKQEVTIYEQAEEIERLKRLLQQQKQETADAQRETGHARPPPLLCFAAPSGTQIDHWHWQQRSTPSFALP